jgi:hypothetical protein
VVCIVKMRLTRSGDRDSRPAEDAGMVCVMNCDLWEAKIALTNWEGCRGGIHRERRSTGSRDQDSPTEENAGRCLVNVGRRGTGTDTHILRRIRGGAGCKR